MDTTATEKMRTSWLAQLRYSRLDYKPKTFTLHQILRASLPENFGNALTKKRNGFFVFSFAFVYVYGLNTQLIIRPEVAVGDACIFKKLFNVVEGQM